MQVQLLLKVYLIYRNNAILKQKSHVLIPDF